MATYWQSPTPPLMIKCSNQFCTNLMTSLGPHCDYANDKDKHLPNKQTTIWPDAYSNISHKNINVKTLLKMADICSEWESLESRNLCHLYWSFSTWFTNSIWKTCNVNAVILIIWKAWWSSGKGSCHITSYLQVWIWV